MVEKTTINMKAAVCRKFGQGLEIEELLIDPPLSGEILVRVAVCAICHSDIAYMDGAWGGTLPAVYGHEAAGTVAALGAGVNGFEIGDPVVVSLIRSCGRCFYCTQGDLHLCETHFPQDASSRLHDTGGQPVHAAMRCGAFAECVVVHQSQLVRIPPGVPLESASLLACGVITGYGAVVNTARVRPGSSVVVVGAGGVGLNCLQGARLAGAYPIIAVDLVDYKLGAAREFGASHTCNPRSEPVQPQVAALTGGRGADYVFIAAGSKGAIDQGLALMRNGGTFVMVGMPPYGTDISLEAADFAGNSQRILGSKMGSTRLSLDVPKLLELYRHKRLMLDELISGRYPLEEINSAIDSVRRGEALRNLIVFNQDAPAGG